MKTTSATHDFMTSVGAVERFPGTVAEITQWEFHGRVLYTHRAREIIDWQDLTQLIYNQGFESGRARGKQDAIHSITESLHKIIT